MGEHSLCLPRVGYGADTLRESARVCFPSPFHAQCLTSLRVSLADLVLLRTQITSEEQVRISVGA